jgi:hypothetical protein
MRFVNPGTHASSGSGVQSLDESDKFSKHIADLQAVESRGLITRADMIRLLRMELLLSRLQKSCSVIGSEFVRISVRLSFIMPERMIDATSILHYELEAPPV